jgi:hypothetical protein
MLSPLSSVSRNASVPTAIPAFFPLGQSRYLRVFLSVSLEDAGTDQVNSIGDRMHQCPGVVDDQLA